MTTTASSISTSSSFSPNDLDFNLDLEQKIKAATEGFTNYAIKLLRQQKPEYNIQIICDYILAMNAEINPAIAHKKNQMQIICYLSEYCGNQTPFVKMTRANVLGYLNTLRRSEEADPWHKWIGTYNLKSICKDSSNGFTTPN
jgi:hypothetical protein